jgi:hypothetical protein
MRATCTFVRPGKRGCVEQRADAPDLAGIAEDDGMGIADRDRHDLDAGDELGFADLEHAELLLHLAVGKQARRDLARSDADHDAVEPGPVGEPAGRDACPVAGHLCLRAVRVPDDDPRRAAVDGENFEDAVGVAHRLADVLHTQRALELSPLEEQIEVPGGLPGRESRGRSQGQSDRHAR